MDPEVQTQKETKGPVVGIIIIIIILILGAFYFITRDEVAAPIDDGSLEAGNAPAAVETDPDANIEAEIESDIEAINTDLDELEADLAS